MPLEEEFLARIYTDREFLEGFIKDPVATALNAGFSAASAETLKNVDVERVRTAANSFARKRLQGKKRPSSN